MTIKTIFWDNDGVLIDTEPVYLKATQEILKDVGVKLSKDFYIYQHLKTDKSPFDLAKEIGISDLQIRELQIKRDALYRNKLIEGVQKIEGIENVLKQFSPLFKMAIVTSSREEFLNIIIEKLGYRSYFDFVIHGDQVKNKKPDPEPYIMAQKQSGFKKEECLAIEDTERGVMSAKAAGLICFAIPTDLSKYGDFSLADKVLNNAGELLDIL